MLLRCHKDWVATNEKKINNDQVFVETLAGVLVPMEGASQKPMVPSAPEYLLAVDPTIPWLPTSAVASPFISAFLDTGRATIAYVRYEDRQLKSAYGRRRPQVDLSTPDRHA